MPKGPKGEKRAADVIGNAVRVMEIATRQRDEEYEDDPEKNKAAAKLGRKGGMDFREATDKLCAKLEHACRTEVLSFQTAARLAACRDPAC
jgi:hypothetical protein